MKVDIIPVEKNKNIIFVPESVDYFLADDATAEVVRHLEEGYENIKASFPKLTKEEYEELAENICRENPKRKVDIPNEQLDRLIINISNDCNMRCKYCYANQGTYGENKNMVTLECLKRILDTFFGIFKEIGLIQLFGGEPAMNLDAIEFTGEYLAEKRYKTQLGMVTNTTLVNEKFISMVKRYNIKVTSSVDVEMLHDYLRPFPGNKNSWELVRSNIHKLKDETGQPSQIELTYTKVHEDQGVTIRKVLEELKKEYGDIPVHIAPVCSSDSKYHLPTRNSFIESVNDIYEAKEQGISLTYSTMKAFELALKHKMPFDYFCGAGISTLAVSTHGDIYPCFYFVDNDEFKMGNVYDDIQRIKNIILEKRREMLQRPKKKLNSCKDCMAQSVCTGCLGANYTEMGDPFLPNEEHCSMTIGMVQEILRHAVI